MQNYHFALIAYALFFVVSHVEAHGHITIPAPIFQFDERVSRNNRDACALPAALKVNLMTEAIRRPTSVMFGVPVMFRYQISNNDGAGDLTIKLDPTATGDSFPVQVQIMSNAPGANGRLQENNNQFPRQVDLVVQIPPVQCYGPGGTCLIQVTNGQNFGSCAFIRPIAQVSSMGQLNVMKQAMGGANPVQVPMYPSAAAMYLASMARTDSPSSSLQNVLGAKNMNAMQGSNNNAMQMGGQEFGGSQYQDTMQYGNMQNMGQMPSSPTMEVRNQNIMSQ